MARLIHEVEHVTDAINISFTLVSISVKTSNLKETLIIRNAQYLFENTTVSSLNITRYSADYSPWKKTPETVYP